LRQKRTLETEEQRLERVDLQAQTRADDAAAEDKMIDAMVKRSIELNGP
jgi:hypothetical protein